MEPNKHFGPAAAMLVLVAFATIPSVGAVETTAASDSNLNVNWTFSCGAPCDVIDGRPAMTNPFALDIFQPAVIEKVFGKIDPLGAYAYAGGDWYCDGNGLCNFTPVGYHGALIPTPGSGEITIAGITQGTCTFLKLTGDGVSGCKSTGIYHYTAPHGTACYPVVAHTTTVLAGAAVSPPSLECP